tara:strand:+ start:870 stop:1424 length:555 start_codon:yes stop_codon:yes gene_type:complete
MNFFQKYFQNIENRIQKLDKHKINLIYQMIKSTSRKGGIIYIAGNGGSASTASHMSTDLTKNAKIKSMTFNDTNLITCFANDYGYENWLKAAIKYYTKTNDLVVLLSVSGKSKNLINAANFCKKKKIKLITITGAKKNNPLSKKGTINYWINSKAYNIVETVQMAILSSIVDRTIGKSEYPPNL